MNEAAAALIPAIQQWAATIPYRIRVIVFGSRVNGLPRDDSDFDIAIEFTDGLDQSDIAADWDSLHVVWQNELTRRLQCQAHLVLCDEEESSALLKTYLCKEASYVVYDRGGRIIPPERVVLS